MKLYHGSSMEILKPDLLHSRPNVDFGRGFYTTPLWEQAVDWSLRYKMRGKTAVVSCDELDEAALSECKVLRFEEYDEAWLDFVASCRREQDNTDYDVVIGGIANDRVFNTIELYFSDLIDKNEAIRRLRYERPNLQVCFRSQAVMERWLRFEGSEKL